MGPITLTTDFGSADWFVGAMKGVILSIHSRATIVDLTHEVAAGDVRAGAFALMAGYRFFPEGAIHVAVVDPGVGTARAALVVRMERFVFIGPDNGVLSFAMSCERVKEVRRIENPRFMLPERSSTFHGRDVFAPVAGHLSKGAKISTVGPIVDEWINLPFPKARPIHDGLEGEVIYIDRFGNAITSIAPAELVALGPEPLMMLAGRRRIPVRRTYADVSSGQPVAVMGSTGFVELAVNGGDAARRLRLAMGDKVRVVRSAEAR